MVSQAQTFTVSRAAEVCQVSVKTVGRRLDQLKQGGAYKNKTGQWVIPLGALLAAGFTPGQAGRPRHWPWTPGWTRGGQPRSADRRTGGRTQRGHPAGSDGRSHRRRAGTHHRGPGSNAPHDHRRTPYPGTGTNPSTRRGCGCTRRRCGRCWSGTRWRCSAALLQPHPPSPRTATGPHLAGAAAPPLRAGLPPIRWCRVRVGAVPLAGTFAARGDVAAGAVVLDDPALAFRGVNVAHVPTAQSDVRAGPASLPHGGSAHVEPGLCHHFSSPYLRASCRNFPTVPVEQPIASAISRYLNPRSHSSAACFR